MTTRKKRPRRATSLKPTTSKKATLPKRTKTVRPSKTSSSTKTRSQKKKRLKTRTHSLKAKSKTQRIPRKIISKETTPQQAAPLPQVKKEIIRPDAVYTIEGIDLKAQAALFLTDKKTKPPIIEG